MMFDAFITLPPAWNPGPIPGQKPAAPMFSVQSASTSPAPLSSSVTVMLPVIETGWLAQKPVTTPLVVVVELKTACIEKDPRYVVVTTVAVGSTPPPNSFTATRPPAAAPPMMPMVVAESPPPPPPAPVPAPAVTLPPDPPAPAPALDSAAASATVCTVVCAMVTAAAVWP